MTDPSVEKEWDLLPENQREIEIGSREFDAGYSTGLKEGERRAVDLTLAGAFVIALLAGAIGFAIGVGAFAL